jgi:hypothetical protein
MTTHRLSAEDHALAEALGARSTSDVLPLVLDVARRHAGRRTPKDVLAQYARDAFVGASWLDLRSANRLDAIALDVASAYEAMLLSPLAPLGVCGTVSPSHQDRIVSTLRGTEVVSDPTNVMALECARRLAIDDTKDVRLCTVHQVVRAQRFAARKGYAQHFRLFALAEAGRARADHGFEVDTIVAHVTLLWRLLDRLEADGRRFPERTLHLLSSPHRVAIATRVKVALAQALPDARLDEGALDSGYYDGVRVLLGATSKEGAPVNLADTGLFDWVAKLTSNRRHRFVASGLGLQLVPLLF